MSDMYGDIKIIYRDKYMTVGSKWVGVKGTYLEYDGHRYETAAEFDRLKYNIEQRKIKELLEKL